MYVGMLCVWDPAQSLAWQYWFKKCLWDAGAFRQAPGPPVLTMWCRPTPLTHSLIELRGPMQCLTDIRRQVPRVLCCIPGQLLALGVVHISNVVECSCLPNLWAAVRYGAMLYSPPGNPPHGSGCVIPWPSGSPSSTPYPFYPFPVG